MKKNTLLLLFIFCGASLFGQSKCSSSTPVIKKEVVNNDTVVWKVSTNAITVYIEKDDSKLKDCSYQKGSEDVKVFEGHLSRYCREIMLSGMDSLASLFIENLNPKVISKLTALENNTPVVLHITAGSDGRILNCAIRFRVKYEDIMTSEEIYIICRYLQENFSFKAPEYDLGCATVSFPIRKEKFMINKTVGD